MILFSSRLTAQLAYTFRKGEPVFYERGGVVAVIAHYVECYKIQRFMSYREAVLRLESLKKW